MTKSSIGLDIGSHSIKLVDLRYTLKGVFLTNFAVKDLPPEAGEEGGRNVIVEKIKELLHEENISARKVIIGVSGLQIAIRRISLPSMPKKELKKAVRWEARKLIEFEDEPGAGAKMLSASLTSLAIRSIAGFASARSPA